MFLQVLAHLQYPLTKEYQSNTSSLQEVVQVVVKDLLEQIVLVVVAQVVTEIQL
jgi:hypothetical protein|tara:strand:- start:610 stop:771 length:162 start_codon:yes stop_codon:yes gene_type:complete